MDRVTRSEVKAQLESLIAGRITRTEASRWALQRLDVEVLDDQTGQAVEALLGADSAVDAQTWLYDESDFARWLAELER